MIAAIATDTERAGTVGATDIMIKTASTIAVAETIAMVATRASNGRDAAKAVCRASDAREELRIDHTGSAMAGTLPDIAASFSRRIESDPAGLRMTLGLWFVHIGERRHHKYIDAPKQVVLRTRSSSRNS
jgi:hypothetical protein